MKIGQKDLLVTPGWSESVRVRARALGAALGWLSIRPSKYIPNPEKILFGPFEKLFSAPYSLIFCIFESWLRISKTRIKRIWCFYHLWAWILLLRLLYITTKDPLMILHTFWEDPWPLFNSIQPKIWTTQVVHSKFKVHGPISKLSH